MFPEKEVDFKVSFQSCVGISGKEFPLSFGNYCGIGESKDFDGLYCCNMWAENINEFKRLHPEIEQVKLKVFGHIAVVVDERIPPEWRSSFCLNGYGGMARKFLEPLLEYCDQPVERHICGCESPDQHPAMWEVRDLEGLPILRCKHCKKERRVTL